MGIIVVPTLMASTFQDGVVQCSAARRRFSVMSPTTMPTTVTTMLNRVNQSASQSIALTVSPDLARSDHPNRGRVLLSNSIAGLIRLDVSPTLAELQGYWDALAVDATIVEPLAASAWSAGFGILTDRFGVTWSASVAAE